MLAIVDAEVWCGDGTRYPRATVLASGGKISAVGPDLPVPEGAVVIDGRGRILTPGFIDAHTHAGIHEEGLGPDGSDGNEVTDPVTPHLRAIDGINPEDVGLADAARGGITAMFVTPGSANVIGGQGAVIKTAGSRTVEGLLVRAPAGLKAATGENPKRVYGQKGKQPATRMGIAALLRETLTRARHYQEKPAEDREPDLKLEAVGLVLSGEIPLRIHCHRADDITTALRVAAEFGIPVVIDHCTEGHKVAAQLAAAGVPAVVGPTITSRSKVELRDRSLETPAVLASCGVRFALCTDHPVVPAYLLPVEGALAIRAGLDPDEALRAVTVNAATICGVADRLGSIEVGRDADLVLWSGDPFDVRHHRPVLTVIDGRVVAREAS